MGTFRHLVIVILVLLLLAYGKAGTGVSISRKADSIQIVLNENQLVFPGETFRIGVTSYSKNGKVKNTSGLISQLMKNNCHTK